MPRDSFGVGRHFFDLIYFFHKGGLYSCPDFMYAVENTVAQHG